MNHFEFLLLRTALDFVGILIAWMMLANLRNKCIYFFAYSRIVAFWLRVLMLSGTVFLTNTAFEHFLTLQTLLDVLGLWYLFMTLRKVLGWNNTLIDRINKVLGRKRDE